MLLRQLMKMEQVCGGDGCGEWYLGGQRGVLTVERSRHGEIESWRASMVDKTEHGRQGREGKEEGSTKKRRNRELRV